MLIESTFNSDEGKTFIKDAIIVFEGVQLL